MAAQVDAKLDNNATPSSSPSPSILFYKVANGSMAGTRHAITILRVIPPFLVIIYLFKYNGNQSLKPPVVGTLSPALLAAPFTHQIRRQRKAQTAD